MWTRETIEAALGAFHEAPEAWRVARLIDAADIELHRLKALDAMDAERLPDQCEDFRTIPRATLRRWVTAELHSHLDAMGLPHEAPAGAEAA